MKQTHWTDSVFIALDTETTGTDPKTARILQAAVITDDGEGLLKEDDHILLINPGVEIPPEASAVHGITADKLVDAWGSQEGIPYLFGLVTGRATARRYPLVIFNACYDWPLLIAECRRVPEFSDFYQDRPQPMFLDPLVIDRALDKYRKGSRKLDAVCAHYGIKLDGAHDAAADARAALAVMRALVKKFPELRKQSLEQMQALQAGWYLDWRDNINQYWARTGKSDRITGTWPMGEEEKAA